MLEFIDNVWGTWLLALKLFRCNKTVSQEAAAVFYGGNTFYFHPGSSWDTLVHWLKVIGSYNRTCLTNV